MIHRTTGKRPQNYDTFTVAEKITYGVITLVYVLIS